MDSRKKDLTQFLVWFRNGSSICITWFLILILIRNIFYNIEEVSTESLIKLMILVAGGVFIFCGVFTPLFIRKCSFAARLTIFMALISVYECVGFYWMGIFVNKGSIIQWLIFAAIIILLYGVSMVIYQIYSNRKGELYTEALYQYQERRSMENGR